MQAFARFPSASALLARAGTPARYLARHPACISIASTQRSA